MPFPTKSVKICYYSPTNVYSLGSDKRLIEKWSAYSTHVTS
jgi:hypothetical protein